MSDFTAMDGQKITDEKVAAWERDYAQVAFPEGERNLSQVIHGSPRSLSGEGSETLSVKTPVAMKRALITTAKKQQLTTSELVRITLAKSLAQA